ncbi:MAG: ribonuclease, partial [Rhodoferax sp.]|nr:ribonuclease [Rhodoferax sp.]
SMFDAAYAAYNGYQGGMERFWTLKYLQQNGITEVVGTVFREGLVRADDLPLVLPVMGSQELPRGAKVRVKLGAIDEITLDVAGTVVERLDAVSDTGAPAVDEESSDEDDTQTAGPIAIAVDMDEAETPETAVAVDNPAP